MSKGTIITLHYCRVNSAADFITAEAIRIFLMLQHKAIKENPAKVQQMYAAAFSIYGFVHSYNPSIPSFETTMHPTPNPTKPAR